MDEKNMPVWPCRCGAVITKIRTRTMIIHLDVKVERLHECGGKSAPDVGYTLTGKRIEGRFLQPDEKCNPVCHVHRVHKCPDEKAKAAAGR